MLLTAGTFLQEGRYWVEGILTQDEMGISYSAQHRNLDIPVVIQTFSPTLGDRPDAPNLLQTFLTEVRRRSHSPAAEPFRIVDCFIEFSQPFVVLELLSEDATPPRVSTWLPGVQGDSAHPTILDDLEPALAEPSPGNGTAPLLEPIPIDPLTNGNVTLLTNGQRMTATKSQAGKTVQSTNGTRPPATRVRIAQPSARRRSPSWLLSSLALTALVGGCTGALFGWQLRQGKPLSDIVPVVGPKVETEQSFPPIDGWPASTSSDIPGDGTGLDQVLQRRSPSDSQAEEVPTAAEDILVESYPLDYEAEDYGTSDYGTHDYTTPDYGAEDYGSDYGTASPPIPSYDAPDVPLATDEPPPVETVPAPIAIEEEPAIAPSPVVVEPPAPPAAPVDELIPTQKPVVPSPAVPAPDVAAPRSSSPPSSPPGSQAPGSL